MQRQKLSKLSTITLSTGRQIPRLGFGTYLLTGQQGIKSITIALKNGYRHLDSATMYCNDAQIRKAMQESGIERQKIYITSKVGPDQHGSKKTRSAVNGVLQKIGCGYLDLMLIHWPGSYTYKGNDIKNQALRLQTWKTLIQLQKQGKIKDIGVSNFLKHHLQHLRQNSSQVPVINQLQIHPLLYETETIEYCRTHDIAIQAYSPLAHNNGALFKNKVLAQLATKYKKTIAQVCLRWGLQQNFIILPKSSNQGRIRENSEIYDFQIEEGDMGRIRELAKIGVRTDWNPHNIIY